MSEGLVIELDGSQHHEQTDEDQHRTRWLEGAGYRVLRVWNNEVLRNMNRVLEMIMAELDGTEEGEVA